MKLITNRILINSSISFDDLVSKIITKDAQQVAQQNYPNDPFPTVYGANAADRQKVQQAVDGGIQQQQQYGHANAQGTTPDMAIKEQIDKMNPDNLCDPPANFCSESLKIPREQMPQLSEDKDIQAFIKEMAAKGIATQTQDVPVTQLKASQGRIEAKKVKGMLVDLDNPKDPSGWINAQPIVVSSDNFVIDGHHRWATLLAYDYLDGKNVPITERVYKVNLPGMELIKEAQKSKNSTFRDPNDNPVNPAGAAGTQPVNPAGAAGAQPVPQA